MGEPRVLHVVNILAGGIGSLLGEVLPEMARLGASVGLSARDLGQEARDALEAAGVSVRAPDGIRAHSRVMREWDVVHFHTHDLDFFASGALSGRPLVYTLHGLRATSKRSAGPAKPKAWAAGVRRRFRRAGLEWFLGNRVDVVTAPSEFLAERLRGQYGVPAGKVRIVRSGIRVDRFASDRSAEDRRPVPVVGFVGRLVPVKRIDLLLEAISGVSTPFELAIVGDGASREGLEHAAAEAGIGERTTFVGEVRDPAEHLARMDVFVLPSREEGSPIAVMEALASGTPCIVMADGGGAVELVEASGAGIVAEGMLGLRAALDELLGDADRRAGLGELAGTYARTALSIERCAADYVDLYRELLSECTR